MVKHILQKKQPNQKQYKTTQSFGVPIGKRQKLERRKHKKFGKEKRRNKRLSDYTTQPFVTYSAE